MQILYNKNDCFFFSPLIGSKKILSRGKFFSKKLALVKNTRAEKVGSLSNGVDFSYVNHNEFLFCIYLWKRPVEKLVESVEKFCLFSALPETAKVEPPKIHRRSGNYSPNIPVAFCVTETDAPWCRRFHFGPKS